MEKYLKNFDEAKLKKVLEVKDAYNAGDIDLDEARRQIRETCQDLKPYEIALAEQKLKEFEEDECRKEDIQAMLDVFQDVMKLEIPNLPKDHPISCYYRENEEMEKLLKQVDDLVQYPVIKNQWMEIYDKLKEYKVHYSRKQNQLYSVLEKKGFDRPTTTMWTLDDFIRDEIRDDYELLKSDKEFDEDEFIERQKTIAADIRDLMEKENVILYPTSLEMINEEEFEDMKSGDHEIGFWQIDVAGPGEKPTPKAQDNNEEAQPANEFAKDLAALMAKHAYGAVGPDQLLDVTTGKLTLEQINLIFQNLPLDISFVDENEIVKFYSDTDHRIFPRSKNVIGREVKNCHPRKSVHIVEEIVEKFRSGQEDTAEFWIDMGEAYIYIYYVAVRDDQGKFRGVMEMMQDIGKLRKLKGSRTLLKWGEPEGDEIADDGGQQAGEAGQDTAEAEKSGKAEDNIEKDKADKAQSVLDPDKFDGDTRLKDILDKWPWIRDDLPVINDNFKMLKTPLARVMIPKATLAMMSERGNMDLDLLISKLQELIREKK